MRPPWFKLLVHNQNRNRRFGLTLAFLIGALRTPAGAPTSDESANLAAFLALIRSMRDETPESHYIHVAECDRLRQPVANPMSSYFKPSDVDRPLVSPISNRAALVFQPQYLSDPERGIDSIAEALWPLLVEPLVTGRFSYYDGAFRPYRADDLAFIAEALALPDDNET